MIPVREKHQFAQAIRTKIVREIAAQLQPRTLVQSAQAVSTPNCFAGELRTRRRTGN
jgi:hypothetical protein